MSLQSIFDDCNLRVTHHTRLHGGDINNAYCLTTADGKFFLKVNDAVKYPSMFECEAEGLKTLRTNASLIVPIVIKHNIVHDQQYLLLEWIETGNARPDFWKQFGASLASLHREKHAFFGFKH